MAARLPVAVCQTARKLTRQLLQAIASGTGREYRRFYQRLLLKMTERTPEEQEHYDYIRMLQRLIYGGIKTVKELAAQLDIEENTLINEISKVDKDFQETLKLYPELREPKGINRQVSPDSMR